MKPKILGSILGAAVGDAMAAATETKSSRQILELFGDRVTEFRTPPADSIARGRRAGQVTDAFSIPYYLTNNLIKAEGKASKQLGETTLLEWSETEYYEPFAGMTTRNVISTLKKDNSMQMWNYNGKLGSKLYKGHYYALSSNGAGSKAYPEGIFSNEDIDKAIRDTVEITMSSHDDPYSISGACAVAAAVSEAMKEKTSVYDIIQAAVYGSVEGEKIARGREDIWIYPGPSVTKRIEMAIEIALHGGSIKDLVQELEERIGNGSAIAETVPTALGIILLNQGDTMNSIFDAVNIGNETCAIACIVGAITGAFNGIGSIPRGYLEIIQKENKMDLQKQAEEIEKILRK